MYILYAIPIPQICGIGPFGLCNNPSDAPNLFSSFISGAIGLMTAIAMIWFIFNFIIGAIGIISAGGDKGKIESARNKITTGITGIIIVIASIFIIQAIGSLIGIGDVILNPTIIIESLTPGVSN